MSNCKIWVGRKTRVTIESHSCKNIKVSLYIQRKTEYLPDKYSIVISEGNYEFRILETTENDKANYCYEHTVKAINFNRG